MRSECVVQPVKQRSSALAGSLFYAFFWGATGVYTPFVNVYFADLGLTGQEIGGLSTLVPLALLLVTPLVSAVSDQFQRRVRVLQFSLLATIVAFGVLGAGYAITFETLLPPVLLLAVASSPIVALADTIIARMSVRYALNFGQLRLWGSLCFATAAIGCGYIWEWVSYEWMFWATAVLLIPSIFISQELEEEPPPTGEAALLSGRVSGITGLPVVLLACFLVGIALSFSFTFDGVYMVQLGGTQALVGLMFGVAALSELPVMQCAGRLNRRLGEVNTLVLACLILLVAFWGYVFAPSTTVLLGFAALRGAGFGLFLVSSIQLVDALSPAARSATAQSLRQGSSFGLSALVAGPLAGWLFDGYGMGVMFGVGGTAVFLAALILLSQRNRLEAVRSPMA